MGPGGVQGTRTVCVGELLAFVPEAHSWFGHGGCDCGGTSYRWACYAQRCRRTCVVAVRKDSSGTADSGGIALRRLKSARVCALEDGFLIHATVRRKLMSNSPVAVRTIWRRM